MVESATSLIAGKKHAPTCLGRVLVLGLGKSGTAAADYCLDLLGDRVESLAVAAGAPNDAACAWAEGARERGATVLFDHEVIEGAYDVCIASPGISENAPFYLSAKAASTEVISEVEFAWRESASASRWVAITGTNGKTTTTALACHLLRAAGMNAAAVGNIGETCIAAVAAGATDVYVAEVSSYQLASTRLFAPDVAVVLNITPDHLSWHGSLEAYAAAKWKALANLAQTGGTAVLNACDDAVRTKIRETRAGEGFDFPYIPIGTAAGAGGDMRAACGSENAAFRGDGGRLSVAWDGQLFDLVFVDDLQIKGGHNQQNALAAASCALVLGATASAVSEGLMSFRPLEHRIEPAGLVDGVACYNDSKATNVDATLVALSAFLPVKPIVLLGGRDKGTDLTPLVAACEENARAVVCFGEARERFLAAFEDSKISPVLSAATMEEALDAALSLAADGDVVVLSPACASFDEFSCFEERGDVFKKLVADRAARS
ncbi:UDP-N-acetylmuramoyl-L-alanine--D-glutamate ligase [Adlercreutzia shanghongiae]|uniref:UDP-N-acetylmuramoylalanine--D-glutamate ligase n=1 Tax=Adlercreutzia shanghongiae TaxID=3111773 RepID=A0ABU6J199_9ACTN|nr:UDP-N-acetylmuramoyl-L-alanine--D-glutamate ligase [Adlercreutzia sp. R22]MEC4295793.1 UDP-N-acetylmuramoyl-L-alanine--D-glutamate ligase [Adlercreutzia sp. R22]